MGVKGLTNIFNATLRLLSKGHGWRQNVVRTKKVALEAFSIMISCEYITTGQLTQVVSRRSNNCITLKSWNETFGDSFTLCDEISVSCKFSFIASVWTSWLYLRLKRKGMKLNLKIVRDTRLLCWRKTTTKKSRRPNDLKTPMHFILWNNCNIDVDLFSCVIL